VRLMLAATLTGLALTSACGSPTPSTAPADAQSICDTTIQARNTALTALAPVSASLAQDGPSTTDIAQATDDLKVSFAALHSAIAASAEQTGDSELKAKITAYQVSVELAIVVVESADGDPAKLAAAIELPEMRSAEQAVTDACG
jgi:hypothetical protein